MSKQLFDTRFPVQIDRCETCQYIWLDGGEKSLLLRYYADLVEMQHADICCGSAGTYNVTQNKLATQILDQKMNSIKGVTPDTIVTANVGCVLQLRAGVTRHGMKADVKHVIELLDEAY